MFVESGVELLSVDRRRHRIRVVLPVLARHRVGSVDRDDTLVARTPHVSVRVVVAVVAAALSLLLVTVVRVVRGVRLAVRVAALGSTPPSTRTAVLSPADTMSTSRVVRRVRLE